MAEGIFQAKDAQELARQSQLAALEQLARGWQEPETKEVRQNLDWFCDQKFGLMIHWGLYNQMGLKESWPLVDNDWSKWQFPPGTSNREVKELYLELHKGFLPLRFDPDQWADLASRAGFKYLIFTTKHHDGFCMWDTKTTDYKVTGPEVPWRDQKNPDITRALWDAFRARGLGISAYFSRADFASPYYWEKDYIWQDGTVREPSYDFKQKPEKWRKFQEYVLAQLTELCTEYGRIECLWYDGGCDGYQLGLPEMTRQMRTHQPWLLGVIRGGTNVCQDFLTPELIIPDQPLNVPWEACTVMGKKQEETGRKAYTSFGYSYDQDYMSAAEIVELLLDVVAKGGNLALNLAPQPDGRLPWRAIPILEELGRWLDIFGPAIYGSRTVAPFRSGQYAFTKKGDQIYAFYIYQEKEKTPADYLIPYPGLVSRVEDVRSGRQLPFKRQANGLVVSLPADQKGRPADLADCFLLAGPASARE
jgi:alpha-L-fucosidase